MSRKKRYFSRIRDQTWVRMYKIESLSKQDNKCKYCKEPITPSKSTGDHIIPRKSGGTTNRENIVACCKKCNTSKGSMPEKKFHQIICSDTVPMGYDDDMMMRWASRRIWTKTNAAVKRINELTGHKK